jgi:ABC-2 type transport system permease protein
MTVTSQLKSPFTWIIVALFAVLSGVAFVAALDAFLDASSDALLAPPPDPINVNQQLIRPFLVDVGLAAILLLPFVTARAASFVRAVAVYVVMLLVSMVPVVLAFAWSGAEWGPVVSGYLGLVLVGAAFIGVGVLIATLATGPWPAGIATLAIALWLVVSTWLAASGSPAARQIFHYFSAGAVLDDFAKGVVDLRAVVLCVTVIALALYLTRPDPRERGADKPVDDFTPDSLSPLA